MKAGDRIKWADVPHRTIVQVSSDVVAYRSEWAGQWIGCNGKGTLTWDEQPGETKVTVLEVNTDWMSVQRKREEHVRELQAKLRAAAAGAVTVGPGSVVAWGDAPPDTFVRRLRDGANAFRARTLGVWVGGANDDLLFDWTECSANDEVIVLSDTVGGPLSPAERFVFVELALASELIFDRLAALVDFAARVGDRA